MDDSALHRVRRLRWQARAPNAADAFALQSLLRRRSEEVGAALEQAFSRIGVADENWHLPSLVLRLNAASLAQMDADLPALVDGALRQALQTALQSTLLANAARRADLTAAMGSVAEPDNGGTHVRTSTAESTHAALRHYLATASLPWTLAGLSTEAQQQTLQGAARVALKALLMQPGNHSAALTDLLGPTTPLPGRIGALLRWLPLLSAAQQQRLLAHSPRPAGIAPALADAWFATLASPGTALEWVALWLVWPSLQGLPALASKGNTATLSPDALATACWIANLPADITAIAVIGVPSPIAPDANLAAALRQALGDTSARGLPATALPDRQSPALATPKAAAMPDSQLVPLAGLVLLHPHLPRLFKACGLLDNEGRTIADGALPRSCALLHALACGNAQATEHQLPLIKLLLGRAPDNALTGSLPRPTVADQEEIDSLLGAVRSHWKALGNTSVNGLRLSFLQRRGLLRKSDGAWQLQMQAEGFDMLLDLLPWSINLVKLPWMALPLMVEWHAP